MLASASCRTGVDDADQAAGKSWEFPGRILGKSRASSCTGHGRCVTTGTPALADLVAFDRFRFDASTGRLWAGHEEVRLTPKAAAVLAVLVGRAGEPVTKDE